MTKNCTAILLLTEPQEDGITYQYLGDDKNMPTAFMDVRGVAPEGIKLQLGRVLRPISASFAVYFFKPASDAIKTEVRNIITEEFQQAGYAVTFLGTSAPKPDSHSGAPLKLVPSAKIYDTHVLGSVSIPYYQPIAMQLGEARQRIERRITQINFSPSS